MRGERSEIDFTVLCIYVYMGIVWYLGILGISRFGGVKDWRNDGWGLGGAWNFDGWEGKTKGVDGLLVGK